jgi:hypothetical protein
MPTQSLERKSVATFKVSCPDLKLLSKILAFLQANFKENVVSTVMVSDGGGYFAFVNVPESCIRETLQEISPFPKEALA